MMWLVRSIDLQNVSYSDFEFKSRREAEEYFNDIEKSKSFSDILIKITDLKFEDYVDYEFDLNELDYDIIRKK